MNKKFCGKILCYYSNKNVTVYLLLILRNISKKKCLVGLTEWIIPVSFSIFVISGIPSNTIVYTYNGQDATVFLPEHENNDKQFVFEPRN